MDKNETLSTSIGKSTVMKKEKIPMNLVRRNPADFYLVNIPFKPKYADDIGMQYAEIAARYVNNEIPDSIMKSLLNMATIEDLADVYAVSIEKNFSFLKIFYLNSDIMISCARNSGYTNINFCNLVDLHAYAPDHTRDFYSRDEWLRVTRRNFSKDCHFQVSSVAKMYATGGEQIRAFCLHPIITERIHINDQKGVKLLDTYISGCKIMKQFCIRRDLLSTLPGDILNVHLEKLMNINYKYTIEEIEAACTAMFYNVPNSLKLRIYGRGNRFEVEKILNALLVVGASISEIHLINYIPENDQSEYLFEQITTLQFINSNIPVSLDIMKKVWYRQNKSVPLTIKSKHIAKRFFPQVPSLYLNFFSSHFSYILQSQSICGLYCMRWNGSEEAPYMNSSTVDTSTSLCKRAVEKNWKILSAIHELPYHYK